jgi:hypothetical protein
MPSDIALCIRLIHWVAQLIQESFLGATGSVERPWDAGRVRELGPERFRGVKRHLGAYAVIAADDAVVTVGHRVGRLLRCRGWHPR